MQVAMTRVDPEFPLDSEKYPGGIRPEITAALPLDRLLRGWTIDAAKQLRQDERFGSLEPGKLANFSVLSDDPFDIPAERLSEIGFDAVIFEGRVVSGAFPSLLSES
jgi:predicted amidohydrolase YtcJ